MKRTFFATLAMLIIVLVGAFSPVFGLFIQAGAVRAAHAQFINTAGDTGGTGSVVTGTPSTAGTVYYGPGGDPNGTGAGEERDPNATDTTDTTTTAPQPKDYKLDCGVNLLCQAVTGYVAVVQFLPHLLAEISGMLLDWVVWKNLQSETWTSQDTAESFVVRGWKLVRDFSNLLFIFALFFIAFSLILSTTDTAVGKSKLFGSDPKRAIAQVILMALLINFSFFMCRVIIDVTNLAGNIFYQKITVMNNGGSNANQTISNSANSSSGGKVNLGSSQEFYGYENFAGIRSVSLGILARINPQELVLKNSDIQGTSHGAGPIAWTEYDMSVYVLLLFVSTMVGFFNFFLIYLFISSGIFLLSRIYGLFFLIILSPIAFVSTTIPALQAKEYFGFDDWFKQLTGLAFCLPIYLFFVYLGIFFLSVGENLPKDTGYITTGAVIAIKLASMGIVLIYGKKVAKDLSGKFGALATNAVTGIVSGAAMVAGAAMTGGTSAALQMTGRLAGQAALSTTRGVGGAIVGDEKAQALEKWMRTPGNTFKRLNNFNPARDMAGKTGTEKAAQLFKNFGAATGEAARMSGSKAPDKIIGGFNKASDFGSVKSRAENIKNLRDEKERKIAEIDKELIAKNARYYDPNVPQREKDMLKMDIDSLERKKARVMKGQPEPVPNAVPNAGTSGNNNANGGNNTSASSSATSGEPNGNASSTSSASGPKGGPRPGGSGNQATGGSAGQGGSTSGGFGGRNRQNYNNASGGPNPTPGSGSDNYADLGVGPNATWEEIREAYLKSAKTDNVAAQRGDAAAGERFRKAKDAYEAFGKDPRYAAEKTTYDSARFGKKEGGSTTGSGSSTGQATPPSGSVTPSPTVQQPADGKQAPPVAHTMNLLSGIQGSGDDSKATAVSNAVDLVPVVGGAKMVAESIAGKTLDGKILSDNQRAVHAAIGAGSIALDATGVGIPEGEALVVAGKGAEAAGQVGVKLAEKEGVQGVSRLFTKSAEAMKANPETTHVIETYVESKVQDHKEELRNQRTENSDAIALTETIENVSAIPLPPSRS